MIGVGSFFTLFKKSFLVRTYNKKRALTGGLHYHVQYCKNAIVTPTLKEETSEIEHRRPAFYGNRLLITTCLLQ